MSRKAVASISVMENMVNQIRSFSDTLRGFADMANNSVQTELNECQEKLNVYQQLKARAPALLERAREKKRQLEKQQKALETQLSNTPKEIEETKTDSQGNSVTVTKPNPEYQRIQNELKAVAAKVAKAKSLTYKISDMVSTIGRECDMVRGICGSMEALPQQIGYCTRQMDSANQSAESSLGRAIRALNDYSSISIRR